MGLALAKKVSVYTTNKEILNEKMKVLESFSEPLLNRIKSILNKNNLNYYGSMGRAITQIENKMAYMTNKYLNQNALEIDNSKDIVKLFVKQKEELKDLELSTHYESYGRKKGYINKSSKIISISNCVSYFSDIIGDNYLTKNNQGLDNQAYYMNLNDMLEKYVGLSFGEIGKDEYTSRFEEYRYFAKDLKATSTSKDAILVCIQNLEYNSILNKVALNYHINLYI